MRFTSLLFSAAAASAAVIARQENASPAKLLIGHAGAISVANYDGKEFQIVSNITGDNFAPSWMLFKEPNLVYAVNENGNDTRLYNLDTATNKLDLVQAVDASAGVVYLEFNSDKTRMVGAGYGGGGIDIWDTSSSGELKLMKTIALTQAEDPHGPEGTRQDKFYPHQAKLDPSGRFFAINLLGSDNILIIDSKDDAFNIASRYHLPTPNSGPRHGVWYPAKAEKATHYMVVCEITNVVEVFSVSYDDSTITFTPTQSLSTYGDMPPANASTAAVGGIIITGKDVYVGNRISGNTTDSISHFKVKEQAATGGSPCRAAAGGISLEFVDSVPAAVNPRDISLSTDEKTFFTAHYSGDVGLMALSRAEDTGKLGDTALASLPNSVFGNTTMFVQQIA